jgi:CBS domain-containing protein
VRLLINNVDILVNSIGLHRIVDLQLIETQNVSGVGVVDEMGKLVDVVSARDLRGSPLNAVSFWGLYSTVAQFKDSIRRNYPQTMKFLLTVKSSDTMEWAIEEMATHKVQRLFLVDDQGKPLKCIAQTDVLRNLLELPGVEA